MNNPIKEVIAHNQALENIRKADADKLRNVVTEHNSDYRPRHFSHDCRALNHGDKLCWMCSKPLRHGEFYSDDI